MAENTDNNDHTGALIILASKVGTATILEQLHIIDLDHEINGYLTHEDSTKRNEILKMVLAAAKAKFANYGEILEAF